MEALQSLRTAQHVAELRGSTVEQIVGPRLASAYRDAFGDRGSQDSSGMISPHEAPQASSGGGPVIRATWRRSAIGYTEETKATIASLGFRKLQPDQGAAGHRRGARHAAPGQVARRGRGESFPDPKRSALQDLALALQQEALER